MFAAGDQTDAAAVADYSHSASGQLGLRAARNTGGTSRIARGANACVRAAGETGETLLHIGCQDGGVVVRDGHPEIPEACRAYASTSETACN